MICENCGKEHDGSYGSGRFCSEKCARSFSTKHLFEQLKEAKCIKCNDTIFIKKRASNKTCLCENCKNTIRLEKIQNRNNIKLQRQRERQNRKIEQ